jgi:hypothetical protein
MLNIAVAALALAIVLVQPAAPLVQSLDLGVPGGVAWFEQGGRTQLVHELHLTNFQQGATTAAPSWCATRAQSWPAASPGRGCVTTTRRRR